MLLSAGRLEAPLLLQLLARALEHVLYDVLVTLSLAAGLLRRLPARAPRRGPRPAVVALVLAYVLPAGGPADAAAVVAAVRNMAAAPRLPIPVVLALTGVLTVVAAITIYGVFWCSPPSEEPGGSADRCGARLTVALVLMFWGGAVMALVQHFSQDE